MNIRICIVVISIIGTCSCEQKKQSMDNFLNDVRKDANEVFEAWGKEQMAWEAKIDSIYWYANTSLMKSASYVDSLITHDTTLDTHKVWQLHTILGEELLDAGMPELALKRLKLSEASSSNASPRNNANMAAIFAQKGKYNTAMSLLEKAAEINYDYRWFMGNLYEMQGKPKEAIVEYEYLYEQAPHVYGYCKERISELQKPNPEFLTEFQFLNSHRRKRSLFNIGQ